jgi:hypothetical protein
MWVRGPTPASSMITYGAASSQPDEPVPACDPELARTTAELARQLLRARGDLGPDELIR